MDGKALAAERRQAVWLDAGAGDFAAFRAEVGQQTRGDDWPLAAAVEANVLIYEGEAVRAAAGDAGRRRGLMAEWATALMHGPGVIAIRGAMPDVAALDRATAIFERIIADERGSGTGGGDHFARPGANNRVWNAAEKHCLADPENFAAYYSADAIAMASEAWLGPGYQVTAQVNRVNPGGAAQRAHRDYHLGFMAPEEIALYPAHIHNVSPLLTLQGAVAHCDMPLQSGPTLYLPYSQGVFDGYLSFGRPEYQEYFEAHSVQLPLRKGDAVFFNPALMHGAGHNRTKDIYRMANLLQVSSAFGRAMESVDRPRMTAALYPVLLAAKAKGMGARALANVIAASAEGYAFPTNLDRDPPVGGLAPKSQAARMAEALEAGMPPEAFAKALAAQAETRLP